MSNTDYQFDIEVATRFLDDQSVPEEGRYVFAYTVQIRNDGKVPARLLGRRWLALLRFCRAGAALRLS